MRQLSLYTPLDGRAVLDVGGGPGYFADAFRAAGARYVGVDPDAGELSARGEPADGHGARQRPGAAVRHRRGGRVLLVERARARAGRRRG